MYFCPNCSYIFDIAKYSQIDNPDENKEVIKKITDLFKLVENNANLNDYNIEVSKDELLKNKRFQKLNQEIQSNILKLYEETNIIGIEFKCNNCNYSHPITQTTLLYHISMDNINNIKPSTLVENELITKNPLLPHTRDYICKNSKCKTHSDSSIKDAIFTKNKDNYKVNYICCICYYNW